MSPMGNHTKKKIVNCWSSRKREGEGARNLLKEIIADNFLNLGRHLDIQVPEAFILPHTHTQKQLNDL